MSGRLQTPLCELLGIRVPILLAGMAGGPATPELVAAVTRAGGLGVFGVSGMTVAALERDFSARARTGAGRSARRQRTARATDAGDG